MYKILICGAGLIGSNLTNLLSVDLKGQAALTVCDNGLVTRENLDHGQFFTTDCVGMSKATALEYMLEKVRAVTINSFKHDITGYEWEVELQQGNYDLVVDCTDNQKAKQVIQDAAKFYQKDCVHVSYDKNIESFLVEWSDTFTVLSDDLATADLTRINGPTSFVSMVTAIAALKVMHFINKKEKEDSIIYYDAYRKQL